MLGRREWPRRNVGAHAERQPLARSGIMCQIPPFGEHLRAAGSHETESTPGGARGPSFARRIPHNSEHSCRWCAGLPARCGDRQGRTRSGRKGKAAAFSLRPSPTAKRTQAILMREIIMPLRAGTRRPDIPGWQGAINLPLDWFNEERPHSGKSNMGVPRAAGRGGAPRPQRAGARAGPRQPAPRLALGQPQPVGPRKGRPHRAAVSWPEVPSP